MNNWLWICVCLLCLGSGATAQPEFDLAEKEARYKGKDIVILKKSEHLVVKHAGAALSLESKKYSEVLYLSDKATHYLNKSIYFCDFFSEISDVKAASYIPDDKSSKLRKINVKNIGIRKAYNDQIFYDDMKELYFNYESLRRGAVSTLGYTEKTLDPHFLPAFYFGTYVPVEQAEFTITFPDDVKFKYLIRDPAGIIRFSETKSRNTTTYTFTCNDIAAFPREEDAPDDSYYLPHVVVYIQEYRAGNKDVRVLSDVQDLYKWYVQLVQKMKTVPDQQAELKMLSDSITAGASDDMEKARRVYYWVQDHIKYIAFEDGLGGFVPRDPVLTLHNRFGDCKDVSMLIRELLRHANVEAYSAWIGTRAIPYRYEELPTPLSDNHMIAVARINNNWIFLDGTADYLQLGLPTSMIQGKDALIGISPDSFVVVQVPVGPSDKSVTSEKYHITLQNDEIEGKGLVQFTGYAREEKAYQLSRVNHEKRIDYISKNLGIGNNKYRATDVALGSHYSDRDSALYYSFNFNVEDYMTLVDDKIYLNLNLSQPEDISQVEAGKRQVDKEVEFHNTQVMETEFDIPAGYELVKVPEASSFSTPAFGFNVAYKTSGNKINFTRSIHIDTLMIASNQFEAWNEFVDKLNNASRELVVIRKRGNK